MDRMLPALLLSAICIVSLPSCKMTANTKSACDDDYTYACLQTKKRSQASYDLMQELNILRTASNDSTDTIQRYENAKPASAYDDAFIAYRLAQLYFADPNTSQKALEKAKYAAAKRKLNAGQQKRILKLIYDASVLLRLPEKSLAAKKEYHRFMDMPFTQDDAQLVSIDVQRGYPDRKDLRFPPQYPIEAARDNVEGYVVMLFDLKENGTTTNIKVIESSPDGVFDEEGIKALKRWVYYPENRTADTGDQTTGLKVRLDWKLEQ